MSRDNQPHARQKFKHAHRTSHRSLPVLVIRSNKTLSENLVSDHVLRAMGRDPWVKAWNSYYSWD